MTFLPFYSNVSDFDEQTQGWLASRNFVMSFSKGEDTMFNNIQRIIYKNNSRCCVVYVGYTVTDIYFMIQISELYIKAVSTYGKIDLEKDDAYLKGSIAKKRIPVFYEIFLRKACEHDAFFEIEPASMEMLCVQAYEIGEMKTEDDFKKGVFMIMKIGQRIHEEYENAIETDKKSSAARDIAAIIRLFFYLS